MELVEATGFEPVTPCLQSRCSPAELSPHEKEKYTGGLGGHRDRETEMKYKESVEALCLWASAIHHLAARGSGHPKAVEALSDKAIQEILERYVGGSPSRTSLRVVSSIEAVERALADSQMPRWFRAYLAFKYPLRGKYEPRRKELEACPSSFCSPESFVRAGHMKVVTGGNPGKSVVRNAVRLIEVNEGTFLMRLQSILKGDAARS